MMDPFPILLEIDEKTSMLMLEAVWLFSSGFLKKLSASVFV